MIKSTAYILLAFALLILCGGIAGFATKQSLMSLIMGILFFTGLFLSGLSVLKRKMKGFYMAAFFSTAFFLLFAIRLSLQWKVFPTLIMTVLGLPVMILSLYSTYFMVRLKETNES